MSRLAALLAAAILLAVAGCGGGGAEPGAPRSATLVLDFQPNAVHAGIYAALEEGLYRDQGVDLQVRQPSSSTDAPKLLAAGRADFAILDIHDLGIARERGLPVVGIAPIVQRPLAAVIARDPAQTHRPRDLDGRTVGVTGLPSDDAVLDSVLESGGADPASVHRVTIGFNAVASLAAGKVDAATAFWNAEGVALRRQGIATREFRVDDYGAPRYPELVLCTSESVLHDDRALAQAVVSATAQGYRLAVDHPGQALNDLVGAVSGLDSNDERAQLRALLHANAFSPPGRFDRAALRAWGRWDVAHGILESPPDLRRTFDLGLGPEVG